MNNPDIFRILGLAIGPILAILVGYWQVRATRELAKAQHEKEAVEDGVGKKDVRIKILLQALFSYPYAFYVLLTELSSNKPLSYASVFLISLSIGIIILGALLNTITFTFASTTNLFKLILSNMEKSIQVDQRLRDAISEFSLKTKSEKPKKKRRRH